MARKKEAAAPSMLPALSGEDWEKELIEHAEDATAYGGGGVSYISTKGGKLTYNGQVLKQPIDVVILDVVRENSFFKGDFDPDSPVPPDCFAVGRDEESLAPPAELKTKESDTCASCWANAFGSAEKGRGKACKNTLRLGILPADNPKPTVLSEAEPALIRVPPTSLKVFAKYAKLLRGAMNRPPFGVISEMEIVDDATNLWRFDFKMKAPIGPDVGAVVKAKRAAIADDMIRPPNASATEDSEGQRRKKASASGKKTPAKFAANEKGRKR